MYSGSSPSDTTVVIPSYNDARYLDGAIESALSQTSPPHEIIIVDDGSTDNTISVCEKFSDSVRLISQPNAGLAAARNKGVKLARTERIVFLDADDRLLPNALSYQHDALKMHPEVDVLAYNFWHVTPSGERLSDCLVAHATGIHTITWSKDADSGPWIATGGLVEALLKDYPIAPAASSIRRSTLETCGGFNEAIRTSEDLDLFLRLAKLGQVFAFIPKPLSLVLQRPKSLCRGNPRAIADRLGVLTNFGKTHELTGYEASALRKARANCEVGLSWQEFDNKAYAKSRSHALRAMSMGRIQQGAKAWIHALPILRRLGHNQMTFSTPNETGKQ
jgi:glycosyltransferase involved in cell wall biosynthesis